MLGLTKSLFLILFYICLTSCYSSSYIISKSFGSFPECPLNQSLSEPCSISSGINHVVTAQLGANVTSWTNPTSSTSVSGVIPSGIYASGNTCQFTEPALVADAICLGKTLFGVSGTSKCLEGSFLTPLSSAILLPNDLQLADVNSDGKLDLIITSPNPNNVVSVSLGNGDGTFQAKVDYAVGTSPYISQVDDFNYDGKLDIATTVFTGPSLQFAPGNRDGTFGAQIGSVTLGGPSYFLKGDFNRDGKLDLVISRTSGSIYLFTGDGAGNFSTSGAFDTSGNGDSVASDFNGDGKLDAVVNNLSGVRLFLGNGDGTFQAGTYLTSCSSNSRGILARDFNRDGKIDIAVNCSFVFSVHLGNGDGTFQSQIQTNSTSFAIDNIATADFDNDNILDVIASEGSPSSLNFYKGNGNGTFAAAVQLSSAVSSGRLAIGDVNNDGRLDLVVGYSTTLLVFLGK